MDSHVQERRHVHARHTVGMMDRDRFALMRMGLRPSVPRDQRRPLITLPGGQFTYGQLQAALRRQLERSFSQRRTPSDSDDENDESASPGG